MQLLAALLVYSYLAAFFGIGYGVAALLRVRMRLTRRRELTGTIARLAGLSCIAVSIAFWWWLNQMWSLWPG
jgi:mannose/fructose/N-acetylgalactosamine-specific phosphotransferase system component IIC